MKLIIKGCGIMIGLLSMREVTGLNMYKASHVHFTIRFVLEL